MFTAKVLTDRLDQKPFRPFRIKMSNGDAYDIPNHDAAWVLRDSVEIGLDPDSEGLVSLTSTMFHSSHREHRRHSEQESGVKAGVLVHPTNLACTGNPNGPSLYHLLEVMGKEKALGRIERALGKC